jgi:Tfp pilus assembly protein PilO
MNTQQEARGKQPPFLLTSVILALFIIVLAVAYNLVIFQPNKEKERVRLEQEQLDQKKREAGIEALNEYNRSKNLNECLDKANSVYVGVPVETKSDMDYLFKVVEQLKQDCNNKYK